MTDPSSFYLKHLVEGVAPVPELPGASSFFSAPEDHLDPNLFDTYEIAHPLVRQKLTYTLYHYWYGKLNRAKVWSTVWIAGSAASYQWSADRGNGDLDVLIGVDWTLFFECNPALGHLSAQAAADVINADLHAHLWPKTAETNIGDRTYEVTYYVNALGSDIRTIHAYAAYDLSNSTWTIRPPELPHDPATLYDAPDWEAAHADANAAHQLRDEFNTALTEVQASHPGTPGWVNATGQLVTVIHRAETLFDDIHTGRRAAFAATGQGYKDPANFRWQAAKYTGAIDMLTAIKAYDYTDYRDPLINAYAERAADMIARRSIRE